MPRRRDRDGALPSEDTTLERVISVYLDARDIWLATAASGDDLVSEGESFQALEAASRALLHHPCLTLAAIRRKVSFVLDAADLYAMVREDEDEAGDLLRVFLSSLVAHIPASESGD